MAKKNVAKKAASTKEGFLKQWSNSVLNRFHTFLDRRPHRSFRRTYRRNMPKYARLPGYIAFSAQVFKTIKTYKTQYIQLTLLYMLVGTMLVGIASQENYQLLTESFETLGQDIIGGDIDTATQTIALFGAAITGGLSSEMTEAQQIYLVLLGIVSWLSVVWFLRQRMNGAIVHVRDALYNSGAPLIPTLIILLIIAVQLVPGALGILMYSTAEASGLLVGGVEAMMFGIAAVLLCVLSLYWATSSFFAAIIVTIPGTYPLSALKMAGDIVIGRRVSIMFRLLWMGMVLLLLWALVLIPVILIAGQIQVDWLPLVPVTMQLLSATSILYAASYVYLLYRKMIDEPAA